LYYSLFVDEWVMMIFTTLGFNYEARCGQDFATNLVSNCFDFQVDFQLYICWIS
jgi:hypothetical protein